jgi:hypothetical protein
MNSCSPFTNVAREYQHGMNNSCNKQKGGGMFGAPINNTPCNNENEKIHKGGSSAVNQQKLKSKYISKNEVLKHVHKTHKAYKTQADEHLESIEHFVAQKNKINTDKIDQATYLNNTNKTPRYSIDFNETIGGRPVILSFDKEEAPDLNFANFSVIPDGTLYDCEQPLWTKNCM